MREHLSTRRELDHGLGQMVNKLHVLCISRSSSLEQHPTEAVGTQPQEFCPVLQTTIVAAKRGSNEKQPLSTRK